MTEQRPDELSIDELEEAEGEVLPERAEMAIISDPILGGLHVPVEPPATD